VSVAIKKIRNFVKPEKDEAKEMSQSSASLKIYTSDSLEKRKEEYKKLYETITSPIEKTDPLDILDEIAKRMKITEQAVMVACAPYMRAAETPHFSQLLGYWRMACSLSWTMLTVTKADIEIGTGQKKGGKSWLPVIDVNQQADRMRRFIEIEVFERAIMIMNNAYFNKDVAPEYIFSVYEPSKSQTILERGKPTTFGSDRGDKF